jgi:hypothetical protein
MRFSLSSLPQRTFLEMTPNRNDMSVDTAGGEELMDLGISEKGSIMRHTRPV